MSRPGIPGRYPSSRKKCAGWPECAQSQVAVLGGSLAGWEVGDRAGCGHPILPASGCIPKAGAATRPPHTTWAGLSLQPPLCWAIWASHSASLFYPRPQLTHCGSYSTNKTASCLGKIDVSFSKPQVNQSENSVSFHFLSLWQIPPQSWHLFTGIKNAKNGKKMQRTKYNREVMTSCEPRSEEEGTIRSFVARVAVCH